jgi:hypothetical protein
MARVPGFSPRLRRRDVVSRRPAQIVKIDIEVFRENFLPAREPIVPVHETAILP